jgi:hypothetical protein
VPPSITQNNVSEGTLQPDSAGYCKRCAAKTIAAAISASDWPYPVKDSSLKP